MRPLPRGGKPAPSAGDAKHAPSGVQAKAAAQMNLPQLSYFRSYCFAYLSIAHWCALLFLSQLIPFISLHRCGKLLPDFFIRYKCAPGPLIISQIAKMNQIRQDILFISKADYVILKGPDIHLHGCSCKHLDNRCFQSVKIPVNERHNPLTSASVKPIYFANILASIIVNSAKLLRADCVFIFLIGRMPVR